MRNILVVAYHYPPEEGSCSDKNIKIVKSLLSKGYKVTLITKGDICEKNSCKDEVENSNLKIIRIKKGVLHRGKSSKFGEGKITLAKQNNITRRVFRYIKNKVPLLIIPDSIIDWNYEVMKYFNENRHVTEDVDMILSISSPYSSHIVSYKIAKKINRKLVLCYGDPWIYETKRKRGLLRLQIEKRLEKKIIRFSESILLITSLNKKKYCSIYNIPEDKVQTYNIGYDKFDKDNLIKKQSLDDKVIKAIYGGSLDPVHRDPKIFIDSISPLNNVEIFIFNDDNLEIGEYISKSKLEGKVHYKGLIKSSDFESLLSKMDVLILFGNRTTYQVPGKVFTYISTGKHILYIQNNDSDEDATLEILKEYGNTTIVSNEIDSIQDGIKNMIDNNAHMKILGEKEIMRFHYSNTMKPIVCSVENCLRNEEEDPINE